MVGKRAGLGDFAGEIVAPEVETHRLRQVPERFWNLSCEMVVREVQSSGERLQLTDIIRNRSVELIRRQIELNQILHLRPNPLRNFTGKLIPGDHQPLQLFTLLQTLRNRSRQRIIGKIDILQPGQLTHRRRESTGEIIPIQKNTMQRRSIKQLNRN